MPANLHNPIRNKWNYPRFIGREAEVSVSVTTKISTHFTKSQLLPATMTVLYSVMELEVDRSPVLGSLAPPSVIASDVAGLCHHRMGHSDGRPQPGLPFLGNHYPLQYCSTAVTQLEFHQKSTLEDPDVKAHM